MFFTNGPGDLGSIPSCHTKDLKKKWYLIPPCLTLGNIRYVSRVKWSNPGKGVAPSPAPQCSSYRKGSLLVANFTLLDIITINYLSYCLLGLLLVTLNHIMSCGYPWPSLATSPYRSSLLAGPQGYIPYPHRALCMYVCSSWSSCFCSAICWGP